MYADVASLPLPMPEVLALIDRVLQVGFGDEDQRLGRAYSLAAKLGDRVPRMDAVFALALGELLLSRRPHAALRHFQAVHGHEASDTEALRGVIAAHMHARDFSAAVSAATAATSLSPRCAELLALCRQLAWLDAPYSLTEIEAPADSPPWTAAQLAEIAPGRDIGPWLDYAIGRSHLLDGEAEQARRFLAPLPAAVSPIPTCSTTRPGHICSARMSRLSGRRSSPWPVSPGAGRSAACCRMPIRGRPCRNPLRSSPASFLAVARARETLAGQGAAAAPVDLTPLTLRDATRPDLFEALRTALGVAVARDDGSALDSLIRQPLFARLPAAERLLWTGLAVRSFDPERARQELRRSLALGRNRAALILAVDALDDGRPAEARELLDGVTGPKAALALAWTDARTGALPQAVERFETLAERGYAQADYALGLLALRDAAGAWARERTGQAKSRAEQAVKALTIASQRAPERFDTTSLAHAARLLSATPDVHGALLPWQEFSAQPWTARQLGFGRLVLAPEATDSPLLQAISRWALRPLPESTRQPGAVPKEYPPEYVALAEAVLRVALLTTDTAVCGQAAILLAGLAERVPAPEIQAAARRAAACAALCAGNETAEASSDPLIALAATPVVLGGEHKASGRAAEDRAEAVRILRAAVAGQSSDPLADPIPDQSTEHSSVCSRMRWTAAVFRSGFRSTCPRGPSQRSHWPRRWVPAGTRKPPRRYFCVHCAQPMWAISLTSIARSRCCAYTSPGRTAVSGTLSPPRWRRPILRAAGSAGEPGSLDNHPVARYATVVGEFETADRLWLRALDEARADVIRLPRLRAEYGRFLCHRAVLAHLDGRREQMFGYLRTAATYVPEPAERILRQLEADERVQKLVGSLFPESPILGWQRPGRYCSLDELITSNPDLRAALDAGRREQITGQWRLAIGRDGDGDGHGDIELWHTIAVLSREDALARPPEAAAAAQAGISATALWMLLLAEPALPRSVRRPPTRGGSRGIAAHPTDRRTTREPEGAADPGSGAPRSPRGERARALPRRRAAGDCGDQEPCHGRLHGYRRTHRV